MYDRLAARLATLQESERTATNDLCLTQQYRDLLIVQAQIKVLAELIAEQPAVPAPAIGATIDPGDSSWATPDGIASDAARYEGGDSIPAELAARVAGSQPGPTDQYPPIQEVVSNGQY